MPYSLLGREIRKIKILSKTEFKRVIQNKWDKISTEITRNFIGSFNAKKSGSSNKSRGEG